jgi:beta-1,4-mannosyl-glycoprotein beta-1,4-N-acetylglucosaminyltransferase
MPKIYDLCPFFNELDLLELRLAELDSVVDVFVIAEMFRTHRNNPKPMFFADNAARFAPWRHKIRHIAITSWPTPDLDDMDVPASPWRREMYQRRQLIQGLYDCAPDDWIVLSDCDEIPRAEAVKQTIAHGPGQYVLDCDLHYYWLNLYCGGWYGPRMFQYRDLVAARSTNPNDLPHAPYDLQPFRGGGNIVVKNAGWHFSYLGGVEAIQNKVVNFAHSELSHPQFRNAAHLEECLATGKDLYNRMPCATWPEYRFRAIDDTYPQYLRENLDFFKHLIKVTA